MPRTRLTGLLAAGLLLIAAAPAAAAPATVTVRVEGKADTLVPRTSVTTTTTAVNKDGQTGHTCTGTSVAGALEVATGGQWTATWDPNFKYFLTGIKGETPATPEFFSLWINGKESQLGVCDAELQQGDDVLFYVARCDAGPPPDYACTNPPVRPLVLTVPSTVAAGAPFSVKVVELAPDGTATPTEGAAVSGGGVSATTGADGTATLTLPAAGDFALRATKANRARSASELVQASVSDVACACAPPTPPRPPALGGAITSIREQQSFARRRAPRTLAGTVVADAGVQQIRLRLTRNDSGRCQTFDGARERFVRLSRCGAVHGRWFAVGDRAQWSYLLPRRLGRGRWVLDIEATDRTGGRTALARGSTRVVFFVR
ncbi:MAG TPA: hypothetical protein VGP78_03245 [Solirubrobacteraceae bacterium]|nr:hypothetical protein [Solirubrobacteraceae bacterium]